MSSLREIRRKIKSIKSTLSVTKAMKMVASTRLTRAQNRILSSRPFALRMKEMLEDIDAQLDRKKEDGKFVNPLMSGYESGRRLIVVVGGDRGLCGSFNYSVIRKAVSCIEENKESEIKIISIGRKVCNYFRRFNYPVIKEYSNIFSRLGFVHAELIGQDIIKYFTEAKASEVKIIYNSFRNMVSQELKIDKLLPIEKVFFENKRKESSCGIGFLYEPDSAVILGSLIPRYVKAQIFRILLDSYAAEMSARVAAMESATKNAMEFIEFLNLKFNKTRQELITRELSELVGAAETLA